MIFIERANFGNANLKLIILCFENMSGLKINFDKSEVVVTGVTTGENAGGQICLSAIGKIPHEIPLVISDKPLMVADWDFLLDKVGDRVDHWLGPFLASAGRLEINNSCLSSLPMFTKGVYLLHDATQPPWTNQTKQEEIPHP
jgi:hypothetical protein